MSDPSWNIFRYVGDYMHFAGMLLALAVIFVTRSVEGFSRKTQVLYQIVYITRYLDVFRVQQVMYLLFFKVSFNVVTALMLTAFFLFEKTYEADADSSNLLAILVPIFVAAYIMSEGTGLEKEMWTLSEFVEPFALVPQYIMCYRAKNIRFVTIVYVMAVGGYRVMYVCNWIYKRYTWHTAYHDYTSWMGGALECLLFIDFVLRIARRRDEIIPETSLGRALVFVDSGAGKIAEKIELSTIGRRLPFGLSGTGMHHDDNAARQWETSDKLVDEESCKLLTLGEDADFDI